MTIAICDDDRHDIQQTSTIVREYLENKNIKNSDVAITLFNNPEDLLNKIKNNIIFDLYILDVIMPRINGIELGRTIHNKDSNSSIIYLTTSKDYALESYDTQALNYLLKPISREKLFSTLDRVFAPGNPADRNFIIVNCTDGFQKIFFDQIIYVELSDRTMHFHLTDGSVLISRMLRERFSAAAAPLLSNDEFIICGSSFVINMRHIKSMGKLETIFSNGMSLILPRTLHNSVKTSWISYWLEQNT